MTYAAYRDAVQNELRQEPGGLTWVDLRDRLGLPCERPCPTWTQWLEKDIGLRRVKGDTRRLVWKVTKGNPKTQGRLGGTPRPTRKP